MSDASIHIVSKIGAVTVVAFREDLADPAKIETFNTQIRKLIGEMPEPRLVIDMDKVTVMSSRFLGVLMSIHMDTSRRSGKFRVTGVRAHLRNTFTIMRLDQILTIMPTIDDAVKSASA